MISMRQKSLSIQQAAFVFQWLIERSGSSSYTVSGTTTYDDDLAFVADFQERFPGRSKDPNHVQASIRLRRLLKRLYDDGWLERWRLSNYDQYHPANEPNWQYVYALPHWLIRDMKSGMTTPEESAARWGG